MTKLLFILFQGSGTNLKSWNEYTESKFLDKLKELGSVYTYQDKIHNIWHYDKTNPEKNDFDNNLDIDLSYVRVDSHIKMVYNDIKNKYNNLDDYKFIPMGWSAGCFLALYFAQVYTKQCKNVVLLDSALWTPNNIKLRLKSMMNDEAGYIHSINNIQYKKLIQKWKNNNDDINVAYKINNTNNIIRTEFIGKHLKLELPIPTIAFVNIQNPEGDEWSKDFNNKTRLEEVKVLTKHNPVNYKAYILENKSHMIFNKKQAANFIIKKIKEVI